MNIVQWPRMAFPNICLFHRPLDGAPLFEKEDVDLRSHHLKRSVPSFAQISVTWNYNSVQNEVIGML